MNSHLLNQLPRRDTLIIRNPSSHFTLGTFLSTLAATQRGHMDDDSKMYHMRFLG